MVILCQSKCGNKAILKVDKENANEYFNHKLIFTFLATKNW